MSVPGHIERERQLRADLGRARTERDLALTRAWAAETRVENLEGGLDACIKSRAAWLAAARDHLQVDRPEDLAAVAAGMKEASEREGKLLAEVSRLRLLEARYAARPLTFDELCATKLADEVAVLIRLKVIDARSPAGDALLDFRDPPSTPRADRLSAQTAEIAKLTAERDAARAAAAEACEIATGLISPVPADRDGAAQYAAIRIAALRMAAGAGAIQPPAVTPACRSLDPAHLPVLESMLKTARVDLERWERVSPGDAELRRREVAALEAAVACSAPPAPPTPTASTTSFGSAGDNGVSVEVAFRTSASAIAVTAQHQELARALDGDVGYVRTWAGLIERVKYLCAERDVRGENIAEIARLREAAVARDLAWAEAWGSRQVRPQPAQLAAWCAEVRSLIGEQRMEIARLKLELDAERSRT